VHYHTTGTKLLFLDCIFQKHRKLKLIIKQLGLRCFWETQPSVIKKSLLATKCVRVICKNRFIQTIHFKERLSGSLRHPAVY